MFSGCGSRPHRCRCIANFESSPTLFDNKFLKSCTGDRCSVSCSRRPSHCRLYSFINTTNTSSLAERTLGRYARSFSDFNGLQPHRKTFQRGDLGLGRHHRARPGQLAAAHRARLAVRSCGRIFRGHIACLLRLALASRGEGGTRGFRHRPGGLAKFDGGSLAPNVRFRG